MVERVLILCHISWLLMLWKMGQSIHLECKDLEPSKNCELYKDAGRCSQEYIAKNCQKTCRLCQPHAILYFTKEPSTAVVADGQNATFECQARSALDMTVKYLWQFNHSYVNENNSVGIRYTTDSTGSVLVINNVNRTLHSGSYQCLAMARQYGSIISASAMLKVAYFRIEAQLTRIVTAKLTKPYLIKLPEYEAFPLPIFLWEYKDKSTGSYVDVIGDQSLYTTNVGDLLLTSVAIKHLTTYKVIIKHQAILEKTTAYLYTVRGRSNNVPCADPTIMSFQTAQNKIVSEGDNVTFECLAVARNCRKQISISWSKDRGTHISSERKITIPSVQKISSGTYTCDVQVVQTSERKIFHFSLQVNEKPKLITSVDVNATIGPNGILVPAPFKEFTSVYWYKDGGLISSNSQLFTIYANNSLRVAYQSPALNGFYQIFYQNFAGTGAVTQYVTMSEVVCGWRLFGNSGSLRFYNAKITSPGSDVICSWLLDTSSTNRFKLTLAEFEFPLSHTNCSSTMLYLYRGSVDSQPPSGSYCAATSTPFPFTIIRGPYIFILLRTKKKFLKNGGFLIKYDSVSADSTPTSTTSSQTQGLTTTPFSITNYLSTAVITTVKTSTQLMMTTKVSSRRIQQGTDSLPVGAVIGVVVGVILITVFVSVCCYRKRLWIKVVRKKPSVDHVPKESLPRFNVYHSDVVGSNNFDYQDELKPSLGNLKSTTPHQNSGKEFEKYEHAEYDRVGSIMSDGHKHEGTYDVVGSTIPSFQKLRQPQSSIGLSIISNLSNTSSTKSEPYYHQLEAGMSNLAYESADTMKCAMNGILSQQTSIERNVARVPSGRSDTQYTPLGEEAVWASKENSIYESLTLESIGLSSSTECETQLGEYCEPYMEGDKSGGIEDPKDQTQGNKCMLYEPGVDVIGSKGTFFSTYGGACKEGRHQQQGEQIYSEPL